MSRMGAGADCAQEFPCPMCLCFSVSKSKELSPGSGQKGSPGSIPGTACPGSQLGPQPAASPSQLPADQSPHTLRKGRSPLLSILRPEVDIFPISKGLWKTLLNESFPVSALSFEKSPTPPGNVPHMQRVCRTRMEEQNFCNVS